MKNKVQYYRLKHNMTQIQLAEKSGLSLRTIQRMEAGTIPKGYSLQAIAAVFGTSPESLLHQKEKKIDVHRVKIINLSALSFLILPFGNIILPIILTYMSKDKTSKTFGKDIISIQIIWTVITSIAMIISPFFQSLIVIKIPFFILILVPLICINVFIIIKNGMHLSQNAKLYISLKNSLL